MSQDLVSLEQAQNHLRRDDVGVADPDLSGNISAASALIISYLKDAADSFTDTAGNVFHNTAGEALGVPPFVIQATLVLVGYLDKNRNSDKDDAFDTANLPRPVRALLNTIRVPTLA